MGVCVVGCCQIIAATWCECVSQACSYYKGMITIYTMDLGTLRAEL